MMDYVRKDSSTAQFSVIRLILTVTIYMSFILGLFDMKGSYIQIGAIKRHIYVIPPLDL